MEKAEPDLMKQPPVKKGTSIFSDGMIQKIVSISIVFTISTLLAIFIGEHFNVGSRETTHSIAQSMTFVVMGLTTIVHMYNCRSHLSIFKIGFTGNRLLLGTTMMGAIIMIAIPIITPVARIVGLQNMGFGHWFFVAILSISPLIFVEIQKMMGWFKKI